VIMNEPLIRPAGPLDEIAWTRLFTGYRDFYRLTADETVVKRVWSWILDPHHETHSIVAEFNGVVIGIADYRTFARPSTGTAGVWLDDLFTDPEHRGRGVGRSLIEYLQDSAQQHGYSIVRWITAEDNRKARQLYDTLAIRTNWVTYDASPRT
jgi:GNAT superfamily N-acetyltransferase